MAISYVFSPLRKPINEEIIIRNTLKSLCQASLKWGSFAIISAIFKKYVTNEAYQLLVSDLLNVSLINCGTCFALASYIFYRIWRGVFDPKEFNSEIQSHGKVFILALGYAALAGYLSPFSKSAMYFGSASIPVFCLWMDHHTNPQAEPNKSSRQPFSPLEEPNA
jgi:hypothetical protein